MNKLLPAIIRHNDEMVMFNSMGIQRGFYYDTIRGLSSSAVIFLLAIEELFGILLCDDVYEYFREKGMKNGSYNKCK